MGHMPSDRKQQKPCNGMAALYRASQQEMGTPALDIHQIDIDIMCHISIFASTSQQIASNMRFLVIHYTYVRFGRLRVRRDGKIHELEATDQVDRAEGEQDTQEV